MLFPRSLSALCLTSAILGFALPAGHAADVPAADSKPTLWHGFEQRSFEVNGNKSLLVIPNKAAEGNPWIWRTEFFGHEPQGDIELLKNGYHVAYTNVSNLYGAPVALDKMDAYYDYVRKTFQLSARTVLEGFSRGGLFAYNWAARHPERVAAIYADAPVCDFKSWPAGLGKGKGSAADWERCKKVYGLSEEEARAYKLNPVDNLEPLAKAHIPLLHVCGDADEVVPMAENTLLLKERYEKLGGSMTLISKPGVGHHPHSLKDPAPIVEFILQKALR